MAQTFLNRSDRIESPGSFEESLDVEVLPSGVAADFESLRQASIAASPSRRLAWRARPSSGVGNAVTARRVPVVETMTSRRKKSQRAASAR